MDTLPPTQYFSARNFTFLDGTVLPEARLAYLDLNPSGAKVALAHTCFRGRLRTVPNFANGALKSHRVIVVALFGNGESASPSNTPGFPTSLDYRDCVAAQRQLLAHLGVESLDVMFGFSMGGQCTYYWVAEHPDFVKNAVVSCSSARTSRHNYQFLEGPRSALENSIDYTRGPITDAKNYQVPLRGLGAFGKAYSAWLTSAEWFDQELYKKLGYETLQEWDADVAGKSYHTWHPDDLLIMLRMWQKGDVGVCTDRGGAPLAEVLGEIKTRLLLLPCETDQYFRWEASKQEAKRLANASLQVIPSVWGHLAGLGINPEDAAWMDRAIEQFIA